jgi:hypothetical protein
MSSTAKPGTFCLVFYALLLTAYGFSLVIPFPFVILYFSLPCTVSLYNTTMHCSVHHASLSLPCTAFLPGFWAWPVHHALLSRHNITPSAMHCPACHALSVYPTLASLPNNAHSVVHCCGPLPSLLGTTLSYMQRPKLKLKSTPHSPSLPCTAQSAM